MNSMDRKMDFMMDCMVENMLTKEVIHELAVVFVLTEGFLYHQKHICISVRSRNICTSDAEPKYAPVPM